MWHYRIVLVSWTIGINTPKAINLQKSVEKFDEFLIRCLILHKEGETQILSRFQAGLRDDLRTELLVRRVNELEAAYALIQDLDSARTNHPSKSHDYRASVSRPFPSSQTHRSCIQTSSHRDDTKSMSLERDNKTRPLIPPEIVPQPSSTNAEVMHI